VEPSGNDIAKNPQFVMVSKVVKVFSITSLLNVQHDMGHKENHELDFICIAGKNGEKIQHVSVVCGTKLTVLLKYQVESEHSLGYKRNPHLDIL
jgi:hypothetical protein